MSNFLVRARCAGRFLLVIAAIWFTLPAQAQYFGQNKPRYRVQDFSVYQTPHFSIYHYIPNDTLLQSLAQQAEHWYALHQQVFKDTFTRKNPLIFYNNHADFQQTTAIMGQIDVGTGGVTEGMKNRVVLPITESVAQTNHVLGHELVHAFQYHLLINADSASLQSIQNLPLWMVEGLAEYLSLGRTDPHTAMWMRDAVLNNDIPSIKDLTVNPRYFPYRYGQAFWAFVTGLYGDTIIEPLFIQTARFGFDEALKKLLKVDEKTLSGMWKSALQTYYTQLPGYAEKERNIGTKIISDENAGRMNLSPAISPDGKYVVFLSEKNLFTLDLFLADAKTGKIIRKLAGTLKDSHFDAFNAFESSGAWSPDSRRFAFVVYSSGINKLVIKDIAKGKTVTETAIPGVAAFSNLSWSPDGKELAFTGLVNGQSDLYLYQLKTKKVTRLTNDPYSDIQPNWSPDGSQLVFATDRLQYQQGNSVNPLFNIAVYNLASGKIAVLPLFTGANNLNPVFSNENQILFLSDRDGYRNLYGYNTTTKKLVQNTRFITGISGITPYSPAVSVAANTGEIVFSHYNKQQYQLYRTTAAGLLQEPVLPDAINMDAAQLPPLTTGTPDVVNTGLAALNTQPLLPADSFSVNTYKPKFQLDYISGGAGVGLVGNNFGGMNGVAGGINMLFSDMLGNHLLLGGLSLNGSWQDFGGQFAYLNQKRRINWGAAVSHTPYSAGSLSYGGIDTLTTTQGTKLPVDKYYFDVYRTFESRADVFAYLPISQVNRVEAGTAFVRYSNMLERYTTYYYYGQAVAEERTKLPSPEGFNVVQMNTAFVGDNSFFGVASPLQGYRYRIGLEQYLGGLNFQTILADFRRYFWVKPVSIAFRAMHYARYGRDANQLTPLFIGNPMFVRGYSLNSLREEDIYNQNNISINQVVGSKMLVGNIEVRLPLSGPERLSLIPSRFFWTELALFADGGTAFYNLADFSANDTDLPVQTKPMPVFSAGVSLRINLFGALVLEPYYAIPIQKETKGIFGFNIVPGW
ncbi:tolB protein precursor [Sphingobacteriales bacterium UPWRP_1]|nr:hypothetical protein BVG80_00720 [Sphingobacteriales bacterium TSM_CSM]PSJ72256.1 tolB protein precursor [Sphingobacteriales bacterium UPWRP_1]